MKHTLTFPTARWCWAMGRFLISLPVLATHAHGKLSPHQRAILESKSPPLVEARFSFDAPPRAQISEAEKKEQRERGRGLLPLVVAAFSSGAAEVRVPAGHYRFASAAEQGGKAEYALCFEGLRRADDKPFVIEASGVTLWFDLPDTQMPPGHRCVGFRNCRNIVLRGVALARGTPGQIEGRITQIDRANNRFEIQPSPGVTVPASFNGSDEQRVLPFKSDGRFCAPLYDLQPGIRKLRYTDILPSSEGRHWVTLRDHDLMQRIHDADWERAFGELGVLRVGDGLCCLYVTGAALTLENSANLTMHGVCVFVDKGGPVEIGGDGAHLWKDCYFGPQPGTCQWKGADGFLSRSLRHGSMFDNVIIRHTADDLANFHGIWGKVQSASGTSLTFERNAALRPTLDNARPGDRLRFIHRKTGVFLGEAKIAALKEFTVTLDRDAAPFAEGQASWPEHECAGWTVQNCRWEDGFQRLLIMSGPGIVRGCTFTRWGGNISLNTGMGLVGGIPSDITIEGNTFTDIAPRPNGRAIDARAHNAQGRDGVPHIERLVITGNTFIRCGDPAFELIGVKESRIESNRIESPVRAPKPK
jgi:hypothetical protein